MRPLTSAAMIFALLALGAAPVLAADAGAVPGFSNKHVSLLENRGLPMSEQEAIERITFRPFVPTPNYARGRALAVVPRRRQGYAREPRDRVRVRFGRARSTCCASGRWPAARSTSTRPRRRWGPARPDISCSERSSIRGPRLDHRHAGIRAPARHRLGREPERAGAEERVGPPGQARRVPLGVPAVPVLTSLRLWQRLRPPRRPSWRRRSAS